MEAKRDKKSVSIVRCDNYSRPEVEQAVLESINLVGGISRYVKPGNKVLLKPNLLTSKSPKGVTLTNPEVVRAVAKIVHEAGGIITIGDSPALEPASRVIQKAGFEPVLESIPVEWAEFSESVPIERNIDVSSKADIDAFVHKLELAKNFQEADVIINLPKLKTHCQMKMTLAVKNLFGFIVGKRKAQWHFIAGENKNAFARMLLEIYLRIKPQLNIMDGIDAMHRNGPNNGDIFHAGIVLASDDALAMDTVIAELAGITAKDFYLLAEAKKSGLPQADLSNIVTSGEPMENCFFKGFEFPEVIDMQFGPKIMHGFLRNAFTSRPKFIASRCKACMACAKICPAEIITRKGDHVTYDRKKCLRCFCCHEICPYDAIGIKRGWLSWLIK